MKQSLIRKVGHYAHRPITDYTRLNTSLLFLNFIMKKYTYHKTRSASVRVHKFRHRTRSTSAKNPENLDPRLTHPQSAHLCSSYKWNITEWSKWRQDWPDKWQRYRKTK